MTRRWGPGPETLHRTPTETDLGPFVRIEWTETTTTNHSASIPLSELRAVVAAEEDADYDVAAFDADPTVILGSTLGGGLDETLANRGEPPVFVCVDDRTVDKVTVFPSPGTEVYFRKVANARRLSGLSDDRTATWAAYTTGGVEVGRWSDRHGTAWGRDYPICTYRDWRDHYVKAATLTTVGTPGDGEGSDG